MIFNLTKAFEANYFLSEGIMANSAGIYTVHDDNKEIGQLVFSSKLSIIKFQKQKFIIRKKKIFTQEGNESLAGRYKISNWTVFKGNLYKLFLNGREYQLKKIKPDQKYSILKKETWGHFKFELSYNEEKIIYSFHIPTAIISLGNYCVTTPFKGKIESNNSEILLILAGLYLIEKALDNEVVS